MFRVFKVFNFDKYAKKVLSNKDLMELDKFIVSLKFCLNLGKPLYGNFLKEKRIRSKRVYFLVYNDIFLILFIAVSDKKSQQAIIDEIKVNLDVYKEYVYNLYKEFKD